MKLIFEWDEKKAEENLRKHKVAFDLAKTVFNDPFLLTFPDVEHSEEEERFINIGTSAQGNVLIVIHTNREGSTRIISSRRATVSERKVYEEDI